MTKRRKKRDFTKMKKAMPYVLVGLATLALVFVGSLSKNAGGMTLSLSNFAQEDYHVSADQLSELYVVADLSDALGLASAPDVASNFVLTTSMYDAGQTSLTGKVEKPNLTNLEISRGVIEYTVQEGDSLEAIAKEYGVSTDEIRWSNGMKTNDLLGVSVLYIPSVSGIVYTVKSGDTAESIAEKYGSNAEEIIALNDLEISGVSEGARILIKGGTLPETERPEYVAPVVTTPSYSSSSSYYTYLGSTATRQNIEVVGYFYGLGGPYGAGQCTQWAWYNRQDLPSNLGNASAWAYNAAAAGFPVSRTPSAGAVFQTSAGWYGHVGYVEAVNPDGSIVVSEMNYNYQPYRVVRSTIPASAVGGFNYIHRK